MDEIFARILQNELECLTKPLLHLCGAYLVLGYIPSGWSDVRCIFIPQSERSTYGLNFRPISLMLFPLKVKEKLIDRQVREEFSGNMHLNPNQHAY